MMMDLVLDAAIGAVLGGVVCYVGTRYGSKL